MKKLLLLSTVPCIFLISSFLSLITLASASGPNTISYQGRLRESGQPVSGIRNIQFKLFDAASAGTPVFDSDSQSIYVSSGIFGYQLGSNKAAGFPNFKDLEWTTSSYWLEISVGGNAMSPREQINAMPYAFMASTAASLNGSGNIQITGAGPHYVANGNVGIGTTNPSYALEVSSWVKSGGRIMDKYGYVAPVGSVQMYASTAAPAGWFLCDGSEKSRTTYTELYEVIGITFGAGDGSTTFNLPDCRGVFVRGSGISGKLTNASGSAFSGGSVGTYSNDRFQGWNKYVLLTSYQDQGIGNSLFNIGSNSTVPGHSSSSSARALITESNSYLTDGSYGTPRPGPETNPANLTLNYIIKY